MEQFKNRLMIQVDKYLLYDDQMKRKLEFSLQAVFKPPVKNASHCECVFISDKFSTKNRSILDIFDILLFRTSRIQILTTFGLEHLEQVRHFVFVNFDKQANTSSRHSLDCFEFLSATNHSRTSGVRKARSETAEGAADAEVRGKKASTSWFFALTHRSYLSSLVFLLSSRRPPR